MSSGAMTVTMRTVGSRRAAEQWPKRRLSTDSRHTGQVHRVAVLACDGVVPFDLSVPIEVFGRARLRRRPPGLRRAGLRAVPVRSTRARSRCACAHGLDALAEADTVVVPGVADIDAPVPAAVLDALRAAPRPPRLGLRRRVRRSPPPGCSTAGAPPRTGPPRRSWRAGTRRSTVDPDVLFVDEGTC